MPKIIRKVKFFFKKLFLNLFYFNQLIFLTGDSKKSQDLCKWEMNCFFYQKNEKIKSVTLINSNGNYYISVLAKFEKKIQKVPSNDKVIGLDFSMSELFVSSENQRADYSRYLRMLEKKLKKLQKSLSRKVKFSKNWYKQKAKISKLHEYTQNCRRNFLHKLSKKLSEEYNAVTVEDLNMKGRSQTLNTIMEVNVSENA